MQKVRVKKIIPLVMALCAIIGNGHPGLTIAAIEHRHYDILIDNKPAGKYTLSITNNAGSTEVTSDCSVHHKILIFEYNYKYHGRESYKNDRLTAFNGDANDNGKHVEISMKRTDDGNLTYTVNGKQGTADGDTLLSSYWSFPTTPKNASDKNNFKFLEVDSGRNFKAQLKYLDTPSLNIDGHPVPCKHYELVGGDDGELWYADNRIVRQKSSNLGHKSIVELTKID